MNILKEINLPQASKYLIFLMIKKGAQLKEISGTNAYLVKFKNKEHIFLGEFTPLTPYMYGTVFSNQKYWFEILKELKIKYAWEQKKREKKIKFLITKDKKINALLVTPVTLIGDGKNNLKNLLAIENLKRINSKNKLLNPIKTRLKPNFLRTIPPKDKQVQIPGSFDDVDISEAVDKKFVKVATKIINFFPGLTFLAFDLFVKDPKKIDNYIIGKVSVSPGEHVFTGIGKNLLEYIIGV